MKEIIEGTRTIYDGKIVKLRVDNVIANGHHTTREIIEKSGAVAIVPINNDGKVIMVRQYRMAIDEELLEIPAGLIDPGEDPLDCAIRELKEETGYTSDKWTHLCGFYTSAGFSNEFVHVYMTENLMPGETNLDETESIEVLEYNLDDLFKMIETGEIHDSKSVAGIALANNLKK